MDRHSDQRLSKTSKELRPRFDDFDADQICEGPSGWGRWLPRGGIASFCGYAIWKLVALAEACLASTGLTELSKFLLVAGLAILATAVALFGAWLIKSGINDGEKQKARKRPPKPGGKPARS